MKLAPKLISFTLLLLNSFNCIAVQAEDVEKKKVQTEESETSLSRVEGPRDMNMFSVEPTVLDERHYLPGFDVRRPTEDQQIRAMLKSRAGLD